MSGFNPSGSLAALIFLV